MILREMLQKVTQFVVTKRMNKCLEVNGENVENLLK